MFLSAFGDTVNTDFRDLLAELLAMKARFLVVGAHAMAAHGTPRATGDLDIWVANDETNVSRVWTALGSFGAPARALGFSEKDLRIPGMVWQIGVPPRRIDILTSIDGVDFGDAWAKRIEIEVDDLIIPVLGLSQLRANKAATGRTKDLADLEILPEAD